MKTAKIKELPYVSVEQVLRMRTAALERIDCLEGAIRTHERTLSCDADYLGDSLRGTDKRLYAALDA